MIQQGNYSSLLYQSKQRQWYELFSAESHKPGSYSLIDKNRNRCLKTSHERGTSGNATVTKHKRRYGNISQPYYGRKHFLDWINTLADLPSLTLQRKKKTKKTLLQTSIKLWPFCNTIREHKKESTFQVRESYFFCIFPGKGIAFLLHHVLVTALKELGGDNQGGHRMNQEERRCNVRAS